MNKNNNKYLLNASFQGARDIIGNKTNFQPSYSPCEKKQKVIE